MEADNYPVDLPSQLAALLPNAIALDVRRAGRGRKGGAFVERLPLKRGDAMVTHNSRTDATDEAVAELVWSSCSNDAAKVGGSQLYRVVVEYAKPRSGPTPVARHFEVQVGEPDEDDDGMERRHKISAFSETMAERRAVFGELLKMMESTTKMAKVMSDMAIGLVGAHESLATRQQALAESTMDAKYIDAQRASDADKMEILKQFLGPTLAMVQAKLGIKMPVPAEASDDPKWPEIVKVARAFARSLTPTQLDVARKCFGSTTDLEQLRDVTDEGATLKLLHAFYSHPQGSIIEVYLSLDATQQSHASTLQTLTAAAGDAVKPQP